MHIYLSRNTAEEGVLSILRHHSVSNAMLRARNIETGFSSYILGAPFEIVRWEPTESGTRGRADGYRERRMNRRALSDTIESILGATFASGGLNAAIHVGDRLGLCFGGTSPWVERPAARELWDVEASPVPPYLLGLQEKLGYTFRQGNRLLEAVTHRSNIGASTDAYERLEYLGDGEWLERDISRLLG
jgi:endoribonuclease Dicer